MTEHERESGSNTEHLPLFPLGTVLFPNMTLSLNVFETRYRLLLKDRATIDPAFGVVLTRSGREVGDQPDVHEIGTSASLTALRPQMDGKIEIEVMGRRRFRVLSGDWSKAYLVAEIEWLDETEPAAESAALARRVRTEMDKLIETAAAVADIAVPELELPEDPTELSYLVSSTLWLNTWERQALLAEATTDSRLRHLISVVRREERLLIDAGASGIPIEQPGSRFLPN